MAAISAALVKELRDRTGLGMMECKKALANNQGDIEKAIEALRKSGQAKAAKKAGRTAAEGVVAIKLAEDNRRGVLIEVNTETDFAARDTHFLAFVEQVLNAAFESGQSDVATLRAGDLEAGRLALVQKIGENIGVRRIATLDGGLVGSYVHGNNRIGVLVALSGGDTELAKDISMHIAAVSPLVVSKAQMPEEVVNKEKEIFAAQAQQSGKPAAIIEKMIVGRINKFLAENSLEEQPFVREPDVKVGALAKQAGATISSFIRFEVGEGIEKESVDFAAEVAAQVKQAT
jgi:elongation factor Ts